MNTYEQKQEQKRQRLLKKAEAARQKSDEILDDAHARHSVLLGSGGQPILRGHLSEKKHLRELTQLDNSMRRSVKQQEIAEYYEEKAKTVGKGGISSDDPDALKKIAARIEELQAETDKTSATYSNIRRLKKRQTALLKREQLQTKRLSYPEYGFDLEQNKEENRIKFIFAEKPSPNIIKLLKDKAFKFSPTKNAWVRLWTGNAIFDARVLRSEIKETIDGAKARAA